MFLIWSYKGKPWILAEGCKSNFYLKPDELKGFEVENRNYSRNDLTPNRAFVNRITAADIDQDGYTEIFLVHRSNLKVFYFKNVTTSNTTNTTTRAASSKLSSNCMVFILACLTGSFQIADMIYAWSTFSIFRFHFRDNVFIASVFSVRIFVE